ncbi:MAG: hypothetical protein M3245_03430, partial [Actinomycetota bacterium]|nr:hypothetical protein [Actinomycetota bacterium]
PQETVFGAENAGLVKVFYSGTSGFGSGGVSWHQNRSGIAGGVEDGDNFGRALSAANFGKSTYADLAIGVPFEDLGCCDEDNGAVHVLYGSGYGVRSSGSQLWTQESPGMFGLDEAGDWFGWALA